MEDKNMNIQNEEGRGITRRTFLKGAAAGAAALSVASVVPVSVEAEAATKTASLFGNLKKYKKIKAEEFPTETPDYVIDPLNQFGTYYTGLWQGSVTLTSGDTRTYKIYVPEGARRDAHNIYLAVPEGVETSIFLQASGWMDIADRDSIVLSVFEPVSKKWADVDTELDYFAKAYSAFSGTTYVYHDIFNWRWVGYGQGGAMMQRYCMKNPITTTSLAVIGGSNSITADELAEIGATPLKAGGNDTPITCGDAAIPVFIAETKATKKVKNVIEYWKKANDVKDEKIELKTGYAYYQKPFSANWFTYDQKCGTVRVLEGVLSYVDKNLTEQAYKFVQTYARSGSGSPYSNSLTYAASDDTWTREEYIIDGYQREWFTYLPQSYDGSEALPLVIFFHGTGQSGLLAQRQGDWWKLADEKNFIAVCPSASLEKKRSPSKVPQMSWNVEDYGNADEIVFVDEMIKILKSEYNIDGGRVYVTGQSNGGRMSIYAGLALPHVVTAVGSAGASALTTGETPTTYFLPKELDETAIVPFLASMGEHDMFNFDLEDETSDAWVRCHYYCNRYNLDYNNRLTYQNYMNTHTIWETSAGVPLQEQLVIGGRAHSNRPVECKILWNEWFAWFTRDEATGTLYYMGKEVVLD